LRPSQQRARRRNKIRIRLPVRLPSCAFCASSWLNLGCRSAGGVSRRLLLTLFAPLFSQSVATRDPFVSPANLPINAATDLVQDCLVKVATGVRDVPRQNSV